jgi:hypothetical protein
MSALGQKQTLQRLQPMSALPPKAHMDQHGCDVRFVPPAPFVTAQRPLIPLAVGFSVDFRDKS